MLFEVIIMVGIRRKLLIAVACREGEASMDYGADQSVIVTDLNRPIETFLDQD